MQTQIVQVGNSLGIRLPKVILDELALTKSSRLHIELTSQSIVLKPAKSPRHGWADAFVQCSAQSADQSLERGTEHASLWGDVPVDEGWGDDV